MNELPEACQSLVGINGRPPLLRKNEIDKVKSNLFLKDMAKNSVIRGNFKEKLISKRNDFIREEAIKLNSPPIRPVSLQISPSSVLKYKSIIVPNAEFSYDQNIKRGEALSCIYNFISMVASWSAALGLVCENTENYSNPIVTTYRKPNKIFNIDSSSIFLGKSPNKKVLITKEAKLALSLVHRTAGTTKSSNAPAIQDRSVQYFSIVSADGKLHAIIVSIKDNCYKEELASIFRV